MTEAVPTELIFTTAPKTEEGGTARAVTEFRLDGELLRAHRPKDSMALWIINVMGKQDDDAVMVGAYSKLISSLFDRATRDHIFARLEDPADDFDISDTNALILNLFKVWGYLDEDGKPVEKRRPKPARQRVRA